MMRRRMFVNNMKPRAMSMPSIIQFCFTFFLAVQVAFSAETRTIDYLQVTYPNAGLPTPIGYSEKTTLISCAILCSSQSQCKSYLWDSKNGNCTTGSWPKANVDLIPSGSMKLFTRPSKCRFNLGYEFRSFGTEERCVYISTKVANYHESREKCLKDGGRLLKSNSMDLIIEMTAMARQRGIQKSFWIGMDDIDTEDRLVWSDGQIVTTAERSLFYKTQPDNGGNSEDCVQVVIKHLQMENCLNDANCHLRAEYACEIVM